MATNDDVLPWWSRSVNCKFGCVLCSYTVYVSSRSSIDSIRFELRIEEIWSSASCVFCNDRDFYDYIICNQTSKVRALIAVAVVGLVGVATYGLITLKNRLADEMLGARVGGIRCKLRMK